MTFWPVVRVPIVTLLFYILLGSFFWATTNSVHLRNFNSQGLETREDTMPIDREHAEMHDQSRANSQEHLNNNEIHIPHHNVPSRHFGENSHHLHNIDNRHNENRDYRKDSKNTKRVQDTLFARRNKTTRHRQFAVHLVDRTKNARNGRRRKIVSSCSLFLYLFRCTFCNVNAVTDQYLFVTD